MDWLALLAKSWHWFVAGLTVILAVWASGHALLHKRDSRAALVWVGFVWFVPLLGAVAYFILGVNRIKRRALELRGGVEKVMDLTRTECVSPAQLSKQLDSSHQHLLALAKASDTVLQRPLLSGNQVELLLNGDAAYPAMLQAISAATTSITLCTYIFDRDAAGLAFAEALGQAVKRGVQVRVLIDATGTRYSWPSILGELQQRRIPFARFLRTFPLRRLLEMNLRNHRKILVIDGHVGFTGGMNLRVGHWLEKQPPSPVRDLHFQMRGPVVTHLQEAFAEDWAFTTGESLRGDQWFPPQQPSGVVIARGITDGPDEDFDKLRWAILAALAAAKTSVRVATPYFIPDATIIAALNLAAMRGVQVDILLPEHSNLPFVDWASTALRWQLLERGCRIWLSPPPFDHSKVFVVDDVWSLVGSTNWDARSLRLNFEFNVECYDVALAQQLTEWFEQHRALSRPITLAEVDGRSLPVRLRDGAARLFSPFL